jgi:hypothetical protein
LGIGRQEIKIDGLGTGRQETGILEIQGRDAEDRQTGDTVQDRRQGDIE